MMRMSRVIPGSESSSAKLTQSVRNRRILMQKAERVIKVKEEPVDESDTIPAAVEPRAGPAAKRSAVTVGSGSKPQLGKHMKKASTKSKTSSKAKWKKAAAADTADSDCEEGYPKTYTRGEKMVAAAAVKTRCGRTIMKKKM